MAQSKVSIQSTGFWGILGITFIVLKLAGVVAWKWVWVLAPLWIGAVLTVLILVVVIIFAAWVKAR